MPVLASLIVFGVVFYLLMRLGCGARMVHGLHEEAGLQQGVEDPVCGMTVDPESSYSLAREGRRVRFCSLDCLQRYERNPEAFSGDAHAAGHPGGV